MIITIGGTYGSGAKAVAQETAKIMDYKLCDDDIIKEAMSDSDEDISENTFRYFDESAGDASLSQLRKVSSAQKRRASGPVVSLVHDVLPLDRRLDEAMRKVMNELADQDNVIILGRCADYYLEGRPNLIRTFFLNNVMDRVKLIMETYDVSAKEAQRIINKTDKRREDYYAFFAGRQWRDPGNYDLMIHRDYLSVRGCAELLKKVAEVKDMDLHLAEEEKDNP